MLGILIIIKYLNLVSATIAAFLLSFLLFGCVSSEAAYSLVYLLKMQFDQEKSDISFNNLASDIVLKAGYLAMCVSINSTTACAAAHNLSALYELSSLQLLEGTVSLADISIRISEVCNPRLLVSCILLSLTLIVFILWLAIPLVPGKIIMRRVTFGLGCVTVLLWGLGSMLQHQTILTAVALVDVSSLGLVTLSRGGRAEAMTWTAFLFLMTATIGLAFGCWREIQCKKVNGY